MVDLIPDQPTQEAILLPDVAVVAVEPQGLVEGGVYALRSGGNEHHIQPQPHGGGLGYHIAQDRPGALLPDRQQRGLRLAGIPDGVDVHSAAQHLAQLPGAVGHIGEPHDSAPAAHPLRQAHGPQDVAG